MTTVAVVNDAAERHRLTETAIGLPWPGPAMASHAHGTGRVAWRVRDPADAAELGIQDRATNRRADSLSADQLMRISYLLAIYEGTQRIWRRAPADGVTWLRRPHAAAPFLGTAPLEFMRRSGIPALQLTRAYIDWATGGPPSRADYAPPPRETT